MLAAPEQRANGHAAEMLQDLHERIASGDVDARDKPLQALREFENLRQHAARCSDFAAVRASRPPLLHCVRENKMDEVAKNTKVYMADMEQLNQAIGSAGC